MRRHVSVVACSTKISRGARSWDHGMVRSWDHTRFMCFVFFVFLDRDIDLSLI